MVQEPALFVQHLKLLLMVGGFRMRDPTAFPANQVQAVQCQITAASCSNIRRPHREEHLVPISTVSPNFCQEPIYCIWFHKWIPKA